MGSVIMDQIADGRGQDLPIMDFFLRTSLMAAQGLRPVDNRQDRKSNPLLEKSVSDGRIVIGRDGQLPVLNQRLIEPKSLPDLFLNFRGELGRR